jgi:hypothetical protein
VSVSGGKDGGGKLVGKLRTTGSSSAGYEEMHRVTS